jgi:hypothetical protein
LFPVRRRRRETSGRDFQSGLHQAPLGRSRAVAVLRAPTRVFTDTPHPAQAQTACRTALKPMSRSSGPFRII